MAAADYLRTNHINGTTSGFTTSGSSFVNSEGVYVPFRDRRPFDLRQKDVIEIKKKHPSKIPLIIERAKNEKTLKRMDKTKFLVPDEISMSQLLAILRKRLELKETQSFYIIIKNKSMASGTMSVGEVYHSERDPDGFLYITYSSQETFG